MCHCWQCWRSTLMCDRKRCGASPSLSHALLERWPWTGRCVARNSPAGFGSRQPPPFPLTIIIGVSLLLGGFSRGKQTSQVMLLMAVAALCSLVQFPFSVPFYFCFVVPLGILAFMAVANLVSGNGRLLLLLPVAVFYLAFVTLQILPSQIYSRGLTFQPTAQETSTVPPLAVSGGQPAANKP